MTPAEKIAAISARIAAIPALAAEPNDPFGNSRIADALNLPDPSQPTRRVRVSSSSARAVLLASQEWAGIVMACDSSNPSAQVRGLCITVRDALTLQDQLATDDPAMYSVISQALTGLVSAHLLTSQTEAALLALAEQIQSWAMAICGETVSASEVTQARRP